MRLLLLLLSLLHGADGWDGLLEEVRLLQALSSVFVLGRLQLRAQASRAPSAAKARVMGNLIIRTAALRLMARATWWWPIATTIAFKC